MIINVLIIDDEKLVRENLNYLISHLNIQDVVFCISEADDGISADALMEKTHFDLLLLDIRMPNMDGMSLMKKRAGEMHNTEFIIVSGYSDFEYVKAALEHGAADYLLKPIDEDEFSVAIQKIISKLRKASESDEIYRALTEFDEKTDENKIERWINLMIHSSGKQIPKAIDSNACSFFDSECWAMGLVCCNDGEGRYSKEEVQFNVFNIIKNIINQYSDIFLVDVQSRDNLTMVIQHGRSIHTLESNMIRILESLEENLLLSLGSFKNTYFASAWEAAGILSLPILFNRCENTLKNRFLNKSGFFKFESYHENSLLQKSPHLYFDTTTMKLIKECEKHIISYNMLDRKYLKDCWQYLFSEDMFKQYPLEIIRNVFTDICNLLIRRSNYYGYYLSGMIDYGYVFDSFSGISQIISFLLELVDNKTGEKYDLFKTHDIAKAAKKYIEENFDAQLTLSDVASYLAVNPNYLSEIYRKEIGINFSTYLTELRIEKACELLKRTDMTIEKITEFAGFSSRSYFQRVFKKIKNMTPSEYKLKNLHK